MLAAKIFENLKTVQKDYFSLLHVVITLFKETFKEAAKKRFKKTVAVLMKSLSNLDTSKFKSLSTDRQAKDEFERIIQFLG